MDTNVTPDVQRHTRNYGIFLIFITGIIMILCIIFVITFKADCTESQYNADMANGIITTISVASSIIFVFFGLPMIVNSHFPKIALIVNDAHYFKPFWAIFMTLISVTFMTGSIWLYTILKSDDFICGQSSKDVCPSGSSCKNGKCMGNSANCSYCSDGNCYDGKCGNGGPCTKGCSNNQTCYSDGSATGECNPVRDCAVMDDPTHSPPIYTDAHKTLFHCTTGLIVLSCVLLIHSVQLLYNWLHETDEEKLAKVKKIITEYRLNPSGITESKLKYIDDLLESNMDDLKNEDAHKTVQEASEIREKMRDALAERFVKIQEVEINAINTKIAEEYIRKFNTNPSKASREELLRELYKNHPDNKDVIYQKLKNKFSGEKLLQASLDTYGIVNPILVQPPPPMKQNPVPVGVILHPVQQANPPAVMKPEEKNPPVQQANPPVVMKPEPEEKENASGQQANPPVVIKPEPEEKVLVKSHPIGMAHMPPLENDPDDLLDLRFRLKKKLKR